MKRASILLAAVLVSGTAGVVMTGPMAQAKRGGGQNSQSQDSNLPIKKGMTLDEPQQAVNGTAAAVGAPNNGVQTYRISVRTYNGNGGVNDHPTITTYMFGVKDGKVTWVHTQK